MERRTFLTMCLAAIGMSALFYTHLSSEKHSWPSVQNNQVVGRLLDTFNIRSWAERLDSDDVEYDEVDVSLLNSQIEPVDEEDYDNSVVDDDTTNDEKEYYTDYEEETDEELEKELPDATDVIEFGDVETDPEMPDELLNDEGKCAPHRHFVFHKKHKCGSTAFRFIFQAYAHKHSLIGTKTFLGPFIGGYPGRFDPRFVAKRFELYDYASSHVRFDGPAFRSVFPLDTKYLTVLREPLSHYESTFNFFYSRHHTYESATGRKNDICCWGMPFAAVSGWGTDAITYLREAPSKWNSSIPWAGRGRNFQAWELGWDVDRVEEEYMAEKIGEMEKDFDLVMISNYYFESLVLLKDTLCMDWPDLYVPPTKVKHYEHAPFTDDDRQTFRKFYHQDTLIYDHFNATFWQKVEDYGREEMALGVLKLKKLYAKCDEDRHSRANNNECGYSGHESIRWDGRARIEPGGMAEAVSYMYENNGMCAWGKFPTLWKKYFPERPLNI